MVTRGSLLRKGQEHGYTKKRDNSFHNTLQKNRAEKPMVVRNAFCIAFF
jgi:hypothetical protein